LWAQEPPALADDAPAAAPAQAEADIPALIQLLDSDRFSQRQEASRRLKELGESAIEGLSEASLSDSRETSRRAFQILKEHFSAGEGSLKKAAEAALRRLAQSEKAPIARQAQDTLTPPPPPPGMPQILPLGAGQQIQVQLQIGGVQQIQVRNVNGVKDIEATEGDRTVKIHEDPDKGITVEIKTKKDGKQVTEKFEAKDAAQLKEKHPEAHRLYEKYNNQGGEIRIQAGMIPGIPMQPFGGGMPDQRRLVEAEPIAERLEKVASRLDEAQKLLEQLKNQPEQVESLQKAIAQLRDAQKELQEARDKTR
jgi:hypothetical protein